MAVTEILTLVPHVTDWLATGWAVMAGGMVFTIRTELVLVAAGATELSATTV